MKVFSWHKIKKLKFKKKNQFFHIFDTSGTTYVWRRLGDGYNLECVVPTVQHGADGIMIWGCMAASGAGYMALCEGRMNFKRYEAMLDKTLKPSIDY